MMYSKKMYLIDEREYDRLIRPLSIKNELSWKRPIETRAKNDESRTMKSILADDSLPEDVKSKNYNQTHIRFVNTKSKLDQTPFEPATEKEKDEEEEEEAPVEKRIKTKPKKKKSVVRYSPMVLRAKRKRTFNNTIWKEY